MTDYEEKYKAFRIDDRMKRDFADYAVGIEMSGSLGEVQIETVLIEGRKTPVTQKEDGRAKLV